MNAQGLVTFKQSDLFKDTKVTISNITLEKWAFIVSNPNQTNSTITIFSDNLTIKDNSQILTRATNLTFLNVTKNFIITPLNSRLDAG